ncbi:MAG: type II secretion system protein [Phycisphaeraceae bacterium]|nr:type II secretion system protein [Phycisphaeraceae bacterium]
MVHKKHKPAFTLIEIMVTVAVIVMMAGVLWKMGHGLEVKRQVQQQKQAFAILDSALQAYYEVAGVFPEVARDNTMDELLWAKSATELMWQRLLSVPESRFVAERLSTELLKNLYVSPDATDHDWPEIYDVWGRPVEYVWHANMAFPMLRSRGPNGSYEEPNELTDDITNR